MDRIERLLSREISGVVSFDLPTRMLYASDASIYEILPAGVVFPRDERDLVRIVRLAAQEGIPLTARGGGSGLAGEALGAGIIVEFSRFMNRIESVERDGEVVVVQPGVVLDTLNNHLARWDRMIGPDPASSGRCTVGGMVGNNSTGAHSMVYGHTRGHLKYLDVVLSDSDAVRFETVALSGLGSSGARGVRGKIFAEIPRLLAENDGLVHADRPRTDRDRSGYLLSGVVDDNYFHPHRLVAGSEGTLALHTRICLGTVKRPAAKRVVALFFRDVQSATDAVVPILECSPSAVEMLDGLMIGLARRSSAAYDKILPGELGACLIVESTGDSQQEADEKIECARRAAVDTEKLAFGSRIAQNQADQDVLWNLRKAGVPLLFRRAGPQQPVPFIEDVAVPVQVLSTYVRRLSRIFETHGLTAAFYAHAGGGELHIRPYLNLRQDKDVQLMESIAEQVCELARDLGGTLSGEHGEGLVRSQFIRRMHPKAYPLFLAVKKIFDPDLRLNPDKIITEDDHLMTKNLRFGSYSASPPRLRFNYRDQPYDDIVERCNGCASCRSMEEYSMCPVFKATGLEAASPRAKANILRNLLYGRIDEESRWGESLKEVYDYCLGCGMCAVECPSGVDIPRLVMEAKLRYAEKHGLDLAGLALSEADAASAVMSRLAPLANFASANRLARRLMELAPGIDRRRKLPRFYWPRRLRIPPPASRSADRPKVALFRDLYARHNDPGLAQTVVDLIAGLTGAEVMVPKLGSCGITALDYGNRKTGFQLVQKNLEILSGLVDEGCTVLSQEPTSVYSLRNEYPGWVDDPRVEKVARNTFELFEWLCMMDAAGKMKPLPGKAALRMKLVYHAPCHLKAMQIGRPSLKLLSAAIQGLEIVDSQAACCGIAGTFGMRAGKFDLSMKIGGKIFEKMRQEHADAGLSECSTCRLQMEQGSGVGTYHPAELLAHACGIATLPAR